MKEILAIGGGKGGIVKSFIISSIGNHLATQGKRVILVGADLEDENYEVLPPEVYTRGFVTSYAEFLSLDVQKVAVDYMVRYRACKFGHHKGERTIASHFIGS